MAKNAMIFACTVIFSANALAGNPFNNSSGTNSATEIPKNEDLIVTGVRTDENGKKNVLMKDKWMKVGDRLNDGSTIVAINGKFVTVSLNGNKKRIFLFGETQ